MCGESLTHREFKKNLCGSAAVAAEPPVIVSDRGKAELFRTSRGKAQDKIGESGTFIFHARLGIIKIQR